MKTFNNTSSALFFFHLCSQSLKKRKEFGEGGTTKGFGGFEEWERETEELWREAWSAMASGDPVTAWGVGEGLQGKEERKHPEQGRWDRAEGGREQVDKEKVLRGRQREEGRANTGASHPGLHGCGGTSGRQVDVQGDTWGPQPWALSATDAIPVLGIPLLNGSSQKTVNYSKKKTTTVNRKTTPRWELWEGKT